MNAFEKLVDILLGFTKEQFIQFISDSAVVSILQPEAEVQSVLREGL